jgi:hypothetical protein
MKRDIRLARYDVRTGWLPPVCPRHGVPATGSRKRRFTAPPPAWLWLLVIVSLLVAALVADSMANAERADIPTCRQCDADRMRVRLVRVALGLGSVATFLYAIVADVGGLALLACLLVLRWVLSMSTLLEPFYAVRGQVVDDQWLDLRDVHPGFIAALRPNPAWAVPQPAGYGPLAGYGPAAGYLPGYGHQQGYGFHQ